MNNKQCDTWTEGVELTVVKFPSVDAYVKYSDVPRSCVRGGLIDPVVVSYALRVSPLPLIAVIITWFFAQAFQLCLCKADRKLTRRLGYIISAASQQIVSTY